MDSQLTPKFLHPFASGALAFVGAIVSFLFLGQSCGYPQEQKSISKPLGQELVCEEEPSHAGLPLWSNEYLSAISPIEGQQDLELGESLAKISHKRVGKCRRSRHRCLSGVRKALLELYSSGSTPLTTVKSFYQLPLDPAKSRKKRQWFIPGRSAADFKKWAEHNPVSLCTELSLVNVTPYRRIAGEYQKGDLLIWGANSKSFHPRWGHIEIVVDPAEGIVCSDHCRTLGPKSSKPQLILGFAKSCEPLLKHRSES